MGDLFLGYASLVTNQILSMNIPLMGKTYTVDVQVMLGLIEQECLEKNLVVRVFVESKLHLWMMVPTAMHTGILQRSPKSLQGSMT